MLNRWLVGITVAILGPQVARGAGTLIPTRAPDQPVRIVSHDVDVVINNGFARTAVTQVFHNPNSLDLEATYRFPLPKSASLAEVSIQIGDVVMEGEVVMKSRAEEIYEEEKEAGRDAGKAEKDEFKTFEFHVTPVRARADTAMRFVYYQPLPIDTGVGRYLYPLEEGGTDECALEFWTTHDVVDERFSITVEVKSASPIDDVRVPGFDDAQIDCFGDGHFKVRVERRGGSLANDFILYYALRDGLPGRVELIPYRADQSRPGTFMMVVTPGIDLEPLDSGADYVFVLDVSGSMKPKLATMADGVKRVLGELKAGDRFRVILFSRGAQDLTGGYEDVTPHAVAYTTRELDALRSGGGTNLYSGLAMALGELDDERATSIVLVTDAVANVGPVGGGEFRELLQRYDVRVFGFLLGNSANWPLMRAICDASGGFSAGVSNEDDIVGQLVLAKSKVTHECLHDAQLRVHGVKTLDTSDELLGNVYRGQQLVFFGRYERGGTAVVSLDARITGVEKTYTTTFEFPEVATGDPEIERLWALDQIERTEDRENTGELSAEAARERITDLGLAYQLVTDHTSMIVLSDEAFARHGVERTNQDRVARERYAQTVRAGQPPQDRQVDPQQPLTHGQSPRRRGAGAIDPVTVLLALLLLAGVGTASRGRAA